jgi:hypothetical protein
MLDEKSEARTKAKEFLMLYFDENNAYNQYDMDYAIDIMTMVLDEDVAAVKVVAESYVNRYQDMVYSEIARLKKLLTEKETKNG